MSFRQEAYFDLVMINDHAKVDRIRILYKGCHPSFYELIFSKKKRCTGILFDGWEKMVGPAFGIRLNDPAFLA